METLPINLTDKIVTWLRALDADIFGEWREVLGPGPGVRKSYKTRDERRSMTEQEWAEVVRIASAFVVAPGTTPWGFNFAIYLYLPTLREPPLFPGLPDSFPEPELVCSIFARHLPKKADQTFMRAWELMSPLTHNPENEAKLLAHGFEKPKPCEDYAY